MHSSVRSFVNRGAILAASVTAAILGCERASPDRSSGGHQSLPCDRITVVSYGGGAYQESHKTAFIEPFTLYTGLKVESVVWGAEYGKLKEMVASGVVPWDVVEVTAAQFARGSSEELFQRLTVLPREGEFIKEADRSLVNDFGVPNVYWSTLQAFRKDDFGDQAPRSWSDFWNVTEFPGARALCDDPRGNLEFALLADGVGIHELYPLDVERAFRKLDAIKPAIKVWWSDGTEPVQLLLTHQVKLTSAWSGRVFANSEARAAIGLTWEGAAHELDYWIVPKGSRCPDAAARFIAFASHPYPMARQVEQVAYGPTNLTALEYVAENVRPFLPTAPENWRRSFVIDADWWTRNEDKVKARWMEWKNQ